MRIFDRLLTVAAACLGAVLALAGPVAAQVEVRPVGDMADRIERISRFADHEPGYAVREMRTPRAATLDVSRRLGAGIERANFGARDFQVRRKEVLGVDLSDAARADAEALGFTVLRTLDLDALDIRVDVLRAPRGQSVRKALKRLRASDPDGAYEANALFAPSEGFGDTPVISSSVPEPLAAAPAGRLGIIDTGVDARVAAFAGADLAQANFGRGDSVTPRAHGTAVAALARRYGAAALIVADVFSGEIEYADAEALARALDWMAGEGIGVINMSLAGPPNALLELAVARAIARGHVVVAAVGNQGPGATPLYPAAYPDVIGVTAVDGEHRIYARANRGGGVDVAAVGVGVMPLGAKGERAVSGTSYAAPAISAFLAQHSAAQDEGAVGAMMALIAANVIDLGEPGFDRVYGAGLLALDAYETAGARAK